MTEETVDTLFSLAIAAETAARDFYHGLVRKFAHAPRAARVWQEMLAGEEEHIHLLEQIRSTLPSERLQASADADVIRKIHSALKFSPQRTLQKIHTLDDAYEVAYELEHSEVNSVVEFIVNEYVEPGLRLQMVNHYLTAHIKRLQALGGANWRRSIRAQEDQA